MLGPAVVLILPVLELLVGGSATTPQTFRKPASS